MSRTVMAHVERIVKTYEIEGADAIEMAQVLDYHVVVKKGEFKAGDLAVYIEVDSIVPDGLPVEYVSTVSDLNKAIATASDEDKAALQAQLDDILSKNTRSEFEFLRRRKFKIKQIAYGKFKIFSQGILFATSIIPVGTEIAIGTDLTEILGITKIVEDPTDEISANSEPLFKSRLGRIADKHLMKFKWYRKLKKSQKPKGVWHNTFPSQSDEENIQKIFTRMKNQHGDKIWYVTEKLEGQNIATVYSIKRLFGILRRCAFGVCTHHRFLPTYDGSGHWNTAIRLDYDKKMKAMNRHLFLRGEHVGPGIQANIYGFPCTDIYLFDVCELDGKRMLPYPELVEFCRKNEFKMVPVLDDNFTLPETVQELLAYSNGYSLFGKNVWREGVVFRLKSDPTVSFKVRSPVYLDKQEKKLAEKKLKKPQSTVITD